MNVPATMIMAPLIEAQGLGKVHGSATGATVEALSGVSFSVSDGEFVSFVGPSGCGKSTLLKIMAGVIGPSAGTLKIEGCKLTRPSRAVGVVFQQPVLLPWRTILQNVLFPAEIRGVRHAHHQRALSLLEMFGLQGFEACYPHELSGGMQQRASIVRALVQDPKVLLMDEPFGALDALTRDRLNVETMRIWAAYRKTIVFVTHSITEAVLLSDRVFVMTPRPGRISEAVVIDLPRPRSLSLVNSDVFGTYLTRIRALLDRDDGAAQ